MGDGVWRWPAPEPPSPEGLRGNGPLGQELPEELEVRHVWRKDGARRVELLLELTGWKAGQGSHRCPGGRGQHLCLCPASGHLTASSLSLPPAWPMEEAGCSSSEDDTDVDVEGLRRRRGLEPSAPQPVRPLGLDGLARGEGAGGELSISVNMCLLGALVLLGLGILLFSSEWCLPYRGLGLPPLPTPAPLSVSLTTFLCLHPQVGSQSRTVVSGEGPWLVPVQP